METRPGVGRKVDGRLEQRTGKRDRPSQPGTMQASVGLAETLAPYVFGCRKPRRLAHEQARQLDVGRPAELADRAQFLKAVSGIDQQRGIARPA